MARSERELGDLWAAQLERAGCWVQKLPASSMAGLPDWLVGRLGGEPPRFVEAKRIGRGVVAFKPDQVTGAQRYFLNRWVQSGGKASLLLLGEEGWVEIAWPDADRQLSRRAFNEAKWSWDEDI